VLDEWKKLAKNQAAIVSATEKTQADLSKLSKSTGADIDSLEIKSARANFLVGTRPEDFGTTSVWTVLEKLESELSQEQDRIAATKAELEKLTMVDERDSAGSSRSVYQEEGHGRRNLRSNPGGLLFHSETFIRRTPKSGSQKC
jgi:hypothetical protein